MTRSIPRQRDARSPRPGHDQDRIDRDAANDIRHTIINDDEETT